MPQIDAKGDEVYGRVEGGDRDHGRDAVEIERGRERHI
jgi:hypothetical protein